VKRQQHIHKQDKADNVFRCLRKPVPEHAAIAKMAGDPGIHFFFEPTPV
jgi:hypothetical protein